MKLEYQKVIVTIPLSDYADDFISAGDPQLHVWVNLPRAMHQKRRDLDDEFMRLSFEAENNAQKFRDALAESGTQKDREKLIKDREKEQTEIQTQLEDYTTRNYEWFSDIWSQGPENTRWPLEDIKDLENNDLMLLGWMADQTRELLRTRRIDQKK